MKGKEKYTVDFEKISTDFLKEIGLTGKCIWRSTDPVIQLSPHPPPRNMRSLSCLQQNILEF